MERMKNLARALDDERLIEKIEQLEKENRNLLEEIRLCYKSIHSLEGEITDLEEENKKLNIKVASLEGEIKGLNSVIEKLKEENQYRESIADVLPEGKGHIAEETIQDLQNVIKELKEKVETLELWLDNKEKLNEEYRKQIDKYKRQYEHSMGEDDELIYEEGLYD